MRSKWKLKVGALLDPQKPRRVASLALTVPNTPPTWLHGRGQTKGYRRNRTAGRAEEAKRRRDAASREAPGAPAVRNGFDFVFLEVKRIDDGLDPIGMESSYRYGISLV